jgi:hypothetical protein
MMHLHEYMPQGTCVPANWPLIQHLNADTVYCTLCRVWGWEGKVWGVFAENLGLQLRRIFGPGGNEHISYSHYMHEYLDESS